jgi:hypothetical protein
VREQRAYLCRGPKLRKKLASFFGDALGKDAETHYIQTVLEVCIDDQIVEAALRIHPQAWWDGENLRKKLKEPTFQKEFVALLRALPPGFNLKLHDWKKDHWCSQIRVDDVVELMAHYTPGNHWLHVQRQLPKEDAIGMGPEAESWVRASLLYLLPVYNAILWDPS